MINNKTEKAIILLSGGMDSTVCVAETINLGYEPCTLHVNYGQRTEKKELESFHLVSNYFNVRHRLVTDIKHLVAIGGSSLTDKKIEVTKADLNTQEIPNSYVPFRNANILSIAVSWAEVLGATAVVIGAVEEDSSGYPDCRKTFFEQYEKMVDLGTKPNTKIKILTPIIHLKKSEIIQRGILLKAPFHLSWSCYQSQDEACGECDSCALRLRGFKLAGIEDPIVYKTRPDYTKS